MDVGSIVLGLLLGGGICAVGLTQILYPEASYQVLAGWQFDHDPELSTAGRLDRRGVGVGLVIIGLMVGYYFIG